MENGRTGSVSGTLTRWWIPFTRTSLFCWGTFATNQHTCTLCMCHALPRACAVPLMAQAFFLAIPRKRQWEEKLFLSNFCYFCENSATLFRVHDLVVSSFLYEKIVGLVWILACSFPNEWLFTIRKFVLIALIVLKIRMINLFPETKCTPVNSSLYSWIIGGTNPWKIFKNLPFVIFWLRLCGGCDFGQ